MTFIDDFLRVTRRFTDAPEIYLRAAAYFCVSFLFAQNVYCLDSRVARNNEWIMLSGAPAITRKSTVINTIAVKFCKSVLESSIKRRFGVSDNEAKKIVDLMFFESGTTEGITDHLSITSDMPEIDRYALVSTEYGVVLKSASKKDYLSDLFMFLSKLYYGEGGNVVLSARGKKPEDRIRRLPPDLYVCALVGLQDLHLYFDPITITQGFARRFIIVHASPGAKDRSHPPIDPTYRAVRLMFEKLSSKYDDMFDNYNDSSSTVLVAFDSNAREQINRIWHKYESEYIENPNSSWLLYKQAAWEHLYKLSVLEAISRIYDPPVDVSGTKVIDVTAKDAKSATKFIMLALESIRPVFAAIDASPRHGNLVLRSGELNYIREMIRSAGSSGISKSDLIKKSGLSVRQLDDLILTLMEAEEVFCYLYNSSGRGRKRFVFFYNGYQPSDPRFEEISKEVYKTLVR